MFNEAENANIKQVVNMKKLEVEIPSYLDYNELIAEVLFDNETVATISQEEGFQNLKIQIYSPRDTNSWIFSFAEFEKALRIAKKALEESQIVS